MKSFYHLLGAIALFYAPLAYAQVESNFSAGGGIRIGWSNTSCDGTIAGSIRYNSGSGGSIDYCNGATWQNISGGGGGGAAANPDRGIQFNNAGSFGAVSTFLYTSTGRLSVGTTTPSYTISLTGTGAAQSIGMEIETTANTAGKDLNIYAGGASGGSNRTGGNLVLNTGRATGNGSSHVQFFTVMPGQGSGSSNRNANLSMTVSSNALNLPGGTTAQRPGSANMQSAANGMIRYNTSNAKFEAYQGGSWIDLIGGGAAGPTRAIQFNNTGSFAGDGTFIYTATGRVGLGTASPVAKLDVEGAVQVGDNGETCSAASDRGNIRYNSNILQVCNDHAIGWENLAMGSTIVNEESCDTTRDFTAPGSHSYKIPNNFGSIIIRMWGAGGGSGAATYVNEGASTHGSTGGTTSIASLNLYATGGNGGNGTYDSGNPPPGAGGSGGTATGGDTNTSGNPGASGVASTNSGAGGNAPGMGGLGGAARPAVQYQNYTGLAGEAPGGGASGAIYSNVAYAEAGGGGSGAYLQKTYNNTDLTPGSIISNIVVGAGGARGTATGYPNGAVGGNGRVTIICNSAPPSGSLLALDDLSDVTITTPANGHTLTYNGTNWVNSAGGATAAGSNTQIQFNSGGSAFGGSANLTWNQGTSKFTVTGDIEYTGVTMDISDQRLKDNITPLSPTLAQIMAMTPVSFTMKSDPRNTLEYGFIAQDVEKIYPALVKTADDNDHTKSMNYIGLIAPMVKALQEQQDLIDEQQNLIDTQQKRIDALEQQRGKE